MLSLNTLETGMPSYVHISVPNIGPGTEYVYSVNKQ